MSGYLFLVSFFPEVNATEARAIVQRFIQTCKQKGLTKIPKSVLIKKESKDGEIIVQACQISFRIENKILASTLMDHMDEYVKKNSFLYGNEIKYYHIEP